MNKYCFLAFLPALAISAPVFAQEAENFSGAKATAIVGLDRVSTPFDFVIENPNGAVFGAALGYDLQSDNFVYGVEAEITGATGSQETGSGEINAGRDIYAGLRLGVAVSQNALIYVKGGYTNFRINTENTVGGNLNGIRLGTGAEINVSDNVFLRGEYRYSNYEVFLSRHQGTIGLGVKF